MINAHVISNKCYFLGQDMTNSQSKNPKIAWPYAIFYECRIEQDPLWFYSTKYYAWPCSKIFEYGQKYLTSFIIILTWSRLFWTSRWIGQKFEFWISNKEGEGRRSRKYWKK